MIKDALEYLMGLTAKSAAPQVVYEDESERHVLANGDVLDFAKPIPPRKHTAGTLDDLIVLANRFVEDDVAPVVWYDESAVVLVIDDAGRRLDLVTLPLVFSDTFAVMRTLRTSRESAWKSQPDFLRLVRIELAGTIEDSLLLDRARKLKIGQTTETKIDKRSESMGHEIRSLAGKDDEVPDDVLLTMPVYKTAGEAGRLVHVHCTVEVDVTRPAPFRLVPMPNEVERCVDVAMGDIAGRLGEGLNKDVPAYRGKP